MTSLATNMAVRTNLQYIAVAEMRNEVFQYSTSTVNFRTTGTFTAPYVSGTQAVSIPAGTILVETGKKLYRGPNPNVPTFLVQVMAFTNGSSTDGRVVRTPGNGQSLLDGTNKAVFGFIDPSSPNVALYSVERNPDHADGLYYSTLDLLTAGGNVTTAAGYAGAGGVAHKGPSLFTGGSLTAGGSTTVIPITSAAYTSTTGLTVYTAANSLVAGQVVTITGAGAASAGTAVYNLTNALVLSANTTTFTIKQLTGLTDSTSTGGTATAIQVGINVAAGGVSVAAGGLTINGGPVTQKIAAAALPAITSSATVNIDLSLGNVFNHTVTSGASVPTYTITNSTPGLIFYVVVLNNGSGTTVIFPANVAVLGGTVSAGTTAQTIGLPAGFKSAYTCIVTA
jgi:hypothetical protein